MKLLLYIETALDARDVHCEENPEALGMFRRQHETSLYSTVDRRRDILTVILFLKDKTRILARKSKIKQFHPKEGT
jgi:hypothetical protein